VPITYAVLFVTEDCNLRCPYCYVPKSPRRLDPAVGREVVDFMLDAPPKVKSVMVCFFGGEPLLDSGARRELPFYSEWRRSESTGQTRLSRTTNGSLAAHDVLRSSPVLDDQ